MHECNQPTAAGGGVLVLLSATVVVQSMADEMHTTTSGSERWPAHVQPQDGRPGAQVPVQVQGPETGNAYPHFGHSLSFSKARNRRSGAPDDVVIVQLGGASCNKTNSIMENRIIGAV